MKIIGIPLIIFLGSLSIGLNLLTSNFKKEEFSSPIEVSIEVRDNLFTGQVDLENGVKYSIVTSGVFDSGFNAEYAKTPKLTLNGKYLTLEGGKSSLDKNLVLDWHWVKKGKIEFEKRYYGSFTAAESCNCTLQLDGLKPAFLKDYKVALYTSIDESYFIYGWLEAMSIYIVIFFGFLYLLIDLLKGAKRFYTKNKKWILGKF